MDEQVMIVLVLCSGTVLVWGVVYQWRTEWWPAIVADWRVTKKKPLRTWTAQEWFTFVCAMGMTGFIVMGLGTLLLAGAGLLFATVFRLGLWLAGST